MKPSIGKLPITTALLFENNAIRTEYVLGRDRRHNFKVVGLKKAKTTNIEVTVPPSSMHLHAIVFVLEP